MMSPSPRRSSTGTSSPPAASATWPSVFVPASPYAAESGSSPAPQASMTITNARFTGADSGTAAAAAAFSSALSGLGARVRLEVDVLEALGGQVRVQLRGG